MLQWWSSGSRLAGCRSPLPRQQCGRLGDTGGGARPCHGTATMICTVPDAERLSYAANLPRGPKLVNRDILAVQLIFNFALISAPQTGSFIVRSGNAEFGVLDHSAFRSPCDLHIERTAVSCRVASRHVGWRWQSPVAGPLSTQSSRSTRIGFISSRSVGLEFSKIERNAGDA